MFKRIPLPDVKYVSLVLAGVVLFAFFVSMPALSSAAEEETKTEEPTIDANPELCNQIFKLPKGTIHMKADEAYMNPEVCSAYAFLISRYTPGPRSSIGLSDARVEGIVKLNPDFAVALAKMLRAAPYMTIISAYRTPAGQGAKNPQSNHVYGCAVDLGYSNGTCSQATCQWVLRNAPGFGIHIRMKYSPEWNHVEPIAKDACRENGSGVGAPVAGAPSSQMSDLVRQLLGGGSPQQLTGSDGQNCTLPDGLVVPCNSIQNAGSQQASQQQSSNVSQGISQSYQGPSSGSSGGQQPVSNALLSGTQNTGGSQQEDTRSILERLNDYAGLRRATSTATSVPVVVYVRRQDAIGLQSTSTASATTSPINDGPTYFQPPASQDTFIPPPVNDGAGATFSQSPSTTWAILENMKNTLLRMLAYLRPFGRPLEIEYTEEYSDWSE